ncbi:MAG: class I SAM-dependent methyltransferase [Candidatus Saccharimonadales bacterium]
MSKAPLVKRAHYPRPSTDFIVAQKEGVCDACGGLGPYKYVPIVKDSLAKEWSLSKDEQIAFSSRESMFCAFCGCSYRLRALAKALVIESGSKKTQSLQESISNGSFNKLKIAEINSCGVLHDILKEAPHLIHSEYQPSDKTTPHQDLTALTYKDNTFDIVLTSDTLEHVPDPVKALSEIYRVLKTDGKHIFTVPMRVNAKTKTRTKMQAGKVINTYKPSFHGSGEPDYLVWNEFGTDFVDTLEQVGFSVALYFLNPLNLKDPSLVIVASKEKQKANSPEYSSVETTFDQARQIKKIAELVNKRELTAQHVANIEAQNRAYKTEIEKRGEYADSLKAELHKKDTELKQVNESVPGKVYTKGRAIKKRFKA